MEGYRLYPLLSRKQIESIVKGLADRISKDYDQRGVVLVCILKGAFMFLSDLVRHLHMPLQIDFVRLASYGTGTTSSGRIEITKDVETPLEGKDVLIVEDIIDSGRTLLFLKERLSLANPRSVKVCALLDKKTRREVEIEGDYIGKEVEDVFIVGYGIDLNEAYRNLPEIYYVTPLTSSSE
ncbi:MAG: hypoxanthine phosphoribosyltransferase [Deltaproteobacteria bacterium RBG_16_48_10]|nr:MAG: hypoxanthine phosphoribosyltransferase [Deltaproteobacteria bacterium RBG_16_48_10]